MAQHHLLLRQIFLEYKFCSNLFNSFNNLTIRFVVWECICADFFVTERWVSTSILEIDCILFPGAWSVSVMCFELSCTSARLSDVALRVQSLVKSVLKMGCCDCCSCCFCWLRQFLFNVTLGCWLWCCNPLKKYSISVLSSHTVYAVSWYCDVGYDCKWLNLPELLSEELCNQNDASPPGPFQEDSVVSERLLVELYPSPLLLEFFHSPEQIKNTWLPLW